MTPRELGFRMPAEWEPHAATWLSWPHERSDWPGKFEPVPWVYGDFVRKLAQVERVRILVKDSEAEADVAEVLRQCDADLTQVDFYQIPTDRSWTRDFCPIFVRNHEEVAMTNWIFNGWGKYDNSALDNAVPGKLAAELGMKQFEPGLVLEGGSIDVNGAGSLLTTEECLLSDVQARNPGKSREEIEGALRDYLGIERVLWLKNGIVGDDTHGHVDDLARFTDINTVVTVVEDDPQEDNYEALQENLRILRGFVGLRVETLPMPAPVYFDGQRLPMSYANFYIANGLVLMPTFNDPNDRIALNKLAELFPGRKVVGVHSLDLVLGLGTLHCMTQQEPRG